MTATEDTTPGTPIPGPVAAGESPLDAWAFDAFVKAGEESHVGTPSVVDGRVGALIEVDGRRLVNFASINFLALQERPDVLNHFAEGVGIYGLTTGGSRMTQGINRSHLELEAAVARQTGKQRGISFATGLLANIGFVHAMSQSADLGGGVVASNRDTVFVLDRDAHWSLWKAVEGLPFGRKVFAFRHNDPVDLDRVLGRVCPAKVVVMFESVYSADGSVAPMRQLFDVCVHHQAVTFVDDANGFMLYGPRSPGTLGDEYAAMHESADFVMVSLSKAVGLEGGVITGRVNAIAAFELLSGTSMFTAAIQPPTAHTATRIIDLLTEQPSIVESYLARSAELRRRLAEAGLPPTSTRSYITSVPINDDDVALAMREMFLSDGYLVPVFAYPAVARNRALLRLIVNAGHTDAHIEGFLDTLMGYRQQFGL